MKSFAVLIVLFSQLSLCAAFSVSSPLLVSSLTPSSSTKLHSSSQDNNNDNHNEQQNRRTAITKATSIVTTSILATTLTSNMNIQPSNAAGIPLLGDKEIPKVPLDQLVNKIEKGKYFGPDIQRVKRKENNYIANSNGAPEKHLPNVTVNGNDIEININHVMKEDHYIQFIWLREMESDEVVLVKACTPNEEKPFLKARVPSGVTLTPCLFCNLHGLWKGEPFTVA